MAIQLPDQLPAAQVLANEGIELLSLEKKRSCLRIALLNLMPDKVSTETQFARNLGRSDRAVELVPTRLNTHAPKNVAPQHMRRFYTPWTQLYGTAIDGLIITGAPVETLAFEAVTYWPELRLVFEWAHLEVLRTLCICWSAQAVLYHFYRTPKHELAQKCFGIYRQQIKQSSAVTQGLGTGFNTPVSRHTEVRRKDLPTAVQVLAESTASGLALFEDRRHRIHGMFNHPEYDTHTLQKEYFRDLETGRQITIPKYYFPKDDVSQEPQDHWSKASQGFFANWLDLVAATKSSQSVSRAA